MLNGKSPKQKQSRWKVANAHKQWSDRRWTNLTVNPDERARFLMSDSISCRVNGVYVGGVANRDFPLHWLVVSTRLGEVLLFVAVTWTSPGKHAFLPPCEALCSSLPRSPNVDSPHFAEMNFTRQLLCADRFDGFRIACFWRESPVSHNPRVDRKRDDYFRQQDI